MKKLGYVLVAALCLGTFANAYALTLEEYKSNYSSYTNEMNKVIQTFAEKMDEELWQKGRETAIFFLDVLAAQSEKKNAPSGVEIIAFILHTKPYVSKEGRTPSGLLPEEANRQVCEGIKEFATFLRSDAMALGTLRTTGMATEKNSTLNSARSKMFAPYRSESTETVEAEMSETEKEAMAEKLFKEMDAETIAMMEKYWKETVDHARAGVEAMDFMSEKGKAQKAQFMTLIDSMHPILTQMEKAETPEQFQEQMMLLMAPVTTMRMQLDRYF